MPELMMEKTEVRMPHMWYDAPPLTGLKLRQRIRPFVFKLLQLLHSALTEKSRKTKVDGLLLQIEPGVFDPSRHFSSKILARSVTALDLSGRRFLDIGTGTGIIAITAARKGARVTAADINPAATQLAAKNASMHAVTDHVHVLCGDLFEPIPKSAVFDWIVFNPPFYPREATCEAEKAYSAGENYRTIALFLNDAKRHLAVEGRIMLILSSDMKLSELQTMFAREGYRVGHCTIRRHLFEVFYLVQLQPKIH